MYSLSTSTSDKLNDLLFLKTGTCPEMQGKYDIGGSEMTVTNKDGLTFQGTAGAQVIMDGEFYRGCSGSVKYNGQSMSFHYAPETCILTYGGNSATKKNCDKCK